MFSLAWSSVEMDDTASVAWGDWDGDGDLDLVVGNIGANRVYQNTGGDFSLAWSSTETDNTNSVAWGDVDGDGDLDLAVGNSEVNRVYQNVGGDFSLAWSSTETDSTASVAWGDWDSDGDLDLAVGNYLDQPNRVYRNAGGTLSLAWSSVEMDSTHSVAWGDWDRDGDLDLAVGNSEVNRVYRNAGGTLSLAWSSAETDVTYSVAWGDWDSDGDLDLVVGNIGANRVYQNVDGDLSLIWSSVEMEDTYSVAWEDWDGDGDLDLAVGNRNQLNRVYRNAGGALSLAWSSVETDSTSSLAWGDWDSDGDLDLAVGSRPSRVYRNEGGALSLAWSVAEVDYARSVAWGDWDGDGDLDLAVGNIGANRVYRNEGETLSLAWSSVETDYTYSVAWGDWDGDGDLDLAVGNSGANRVYQNVSGELFLAWSSVEVANTESVAWGDLDGDGDLDLAVGNTKANHVYRNEDGILSLAWSSTSMDWTTSIAWGDWDGDGDLDLAVGNSGPNRVYRNVGEDFSLAWVSIEVDFTESVAWGDWDGDGDLDLAVGNEDQPNRVYQNVGGTLSLAWSSAEADDTTGMVWGDVDGDGDLDLAVGNYGQSTRVYRNEGSIHSLAWSSTKADDTTSVAWGDWDGDGDLDLAVGNRNQPNRIYQNVGGSLSLAWSSVEMDDTLSVAWGDWDGDDDLDLAVGNINGQPNRVYQNEGGDLSLAWSAAEMGSTTSVAWGDWDGDGDLDLAVGNLTRSNWVYQNVGGDLSLVWSSVETDETYSVTWGDWDGDGDLDLAVGNRDQPNRVYRNVGGDLDLTWSSVEVDVTYSVAWGDMDGDGDLDLAAGNWTQPDRVYQNVGGSLSLIWSSAEVDGTYSVAWADWDSDDDLDLVVCSGRIRVYQNEDSTLSLVWFAAEADFTTSVAWGDIDGDGDLDLAVGNKDHSNRVYRNRTEDTPAILDRPPRAYMENPGGAAANGYASATVLQGATIPITYTLVDPEGDPVRFVQAHYSLDAGSTWRPAIATTRTITTNLSASPTGTMHIYTWDVHGSGVFGASDSAVFRLDVYQGFSGPGPYQYPFRTSRTLPFRVRGTQVRVYTETVQPGYEADRTMVYRQVKAQCVFLAYRDQVGQPYQTNPAGYLQGYGEIDVGDRLFAVLPVTTVADYVGALTFDGVTADAVVEPLVNAPVTETAISLWISTTQATGTPLAYASPFTDSTFLLTDPGNLTIWRRDAYSVTTGISVTDDLWHHVGVTWRSSDGQVKVYKDGVAAYTGTLATGTAISPDGRLTLGSDQGTGGYFAGRLDDVQLWDVALTESQIRDALYGEAIETANLVGVWTFDDPENPGTDKSGNANDLTLRGATWDGEYLGGYTVYHTSGTPTVDGVDAYTVTAPGVQVLTVTAEHPLVLFDLNVALEWDAHNDPLYLQQLALDLKKASQYLYDFTDGQVALGKVTVRQNADAWADAHIAVQASNRLRPFAHIGGVLTDILTETVTVDGEEHTVFYGPGQVRMGATWNRYGDPTQSIGEDWPLILAHELSHYLLYQYDVYMGLNEDDLLVPQDTCTGSAMGDVYDLNNSELIADPLHWTSACSQTLAAETLGRTEWQTVLAHYPALNAPVSTNTGPERLPFDFTTVEILSPTVVLDTIEDPTFYLEYEGGAVSSTEARAFLLRDAEGELIPGVDDYEYIYDLGNPIGGQNRVVARGAQPGDRLCVIDRARGQYGCEIITRGDERLALVVDDTWTPVIQLTPVNSTTFTLQVTGLADDGLTLKARLYPEFGSVFTTTELMYLPSLDGYTGTLHLAYPAMLGHVQVWVDEGAPPTETDPRREAFVSFSIGGNPGISRVYGGGISRVYGGGISRVYGGGISRVYGGGISRVYGGGELRAGEAPMASPDGQMILYASDEITFADGQFYTIQAMTGLPDLPPGRTAIGQGYHLVATGFPDATDALTGSVSIQYLGSDVLAAEANEDDLELYYYDGTTGQWQALPTVTNSYYNIASAPSQGAGIYALLASVKLPLYGPGWNNIAYPIRATQPVTQALLSISGYYTTVYGYQTTDSVDPWRVYDVTVPEWVNDLAVLEFGKGYWINVTQAITLYLSSGPTLYAPAILQATLPLPPATYYGTVAGTETWIPEAGMSVTAWVAGQLCGQAQTQDVDGQIVYAIDVLADGYGAAVGCGEPGKNVSFQVDGQVLVPSVPWDDRQLREVTLKPAQHVYLPLILKQ